MTTGMVRVVIGVDPPAGVGGDACGIVVVALGEDGVGHVLEDASISGLEPEGWARRVADAAVRHKADRVIAEANNGGAMVTSVLRAVDAGLPVTRVHAAHGKVARAEPVAALYAARRVRHVGAFPALEDEMCGLVAGGRYEGPGRSPDRADALVWALSELMLGRRSSPGVRMV
jgi:phage terminase large subunit-like protein